MTYDYKADALAAYKVWMQHMREKVLREGAWQNIGPRDDQERELVKKS